MKVSSLLLRKLQNPSGQKDVVPMMKSSIAVQSVCSTSTQQKLRNKTGLVVSATKTSKVGADQVEQHVSRPRSVHHQLNLPLKGATIPDLQASVHAAVKRAELEKKERVVFDAKSFTDCCLAADGEETAAKLLLDDKPKVIPQNEVIELIATQSVLSTYKYDRLKTTSPQSSQPPRLIVDVKSSSEKQFVANGAIIGNAVCNARNLGNLRHDEGTTHYYREYIKREVLTLPNVKLLSHIQGDQLQKQGLRLLHAVGKGAMERAPPFLSVFEYNGTKNGNKKSKTSQSSIALVGKGISFDSGGLNVKPFGSMETMHMDMMGAAAVIGTIQAASRLALPINIVGVVAFAENAIGPNSIHPSSIVRSLKGTTVEITNTDAEGRLILADALTYLQKLPLLRKPGTIIDLATLTGAVVVALGDRRAGLFGNDQSLIKNLFASGVRTNELLWPLPIGSEHTKEMKGNLSDLVNATSKREAGACTAAAFLKNFIEPGVKWAHIDIAGPGMGTKKKGTLPDGAPGFGVQLLVDFLRQQAAGNKPSGHAKKK